MKKLILNHWKIIVIIVIFVIAVAVLCFSLDSDDNVIGVGDFKYTDSDFNMYVYSGKYNIYGKDNTNLPEATLNSDYKEGITVREYLKKKATNEIIIAGVVRTLSKANNIKLSEKDKADIENEKNNYIKSLGGMSSFKQLLSDNNTSEKAYDKMLETDKLYHLLFKSLYAKDKKNDLTNVEKKSAKKEYASSYYKIKQIVIAKIDLTSNNKLSNVEINQRKELANSLCNRALNGEDFDYLYKNYSDDTTNDNVIYFKSGEVLDEIEKVTVSIDPGNVGKLVETDKAFYIIKREKLDSNYLEKFYDVKRDEKLLKDIANYQNNAPIIYYDAFENLKIN